MKPKLIALNLILLAALAAIIWQARVQWNQARETRRSNLINPVKPVAPPPTVPVPKPEAATATRYAEVADKNLFSKDRNANIVVEVPKVEAPKPMPPLPVVYGVMGLPSGVKAIMSEKSGAPSTTVRAGETIGPFKVVALDTQNVTFDWEGKQVARKIDDLIDRSNTQTAGGGGQPAGGGPAAAAPSGPAAPPPPQAVNNNPTSKDLGITLTASTRACLPNDTTPAGAVVEGYKKTLYPSPFGTACRWVKQ